MHINQNYKVLDLHCALHITPNFSADNIVRIIRKKVIFLVIKYVIYKGCVNTDVGA